MEQLKALQFTFFRVRGKFLYEEVCTWSWVGGILLCCLTTINKCHFFDYY